MQKNLAAAFEGNDAAIRTLESLGVSVSKLKKLSPDEQFTALGEAISRIQDPTLRTAMAMRVFGRAGSQLLPMFADGASGINALRARCRELGLTVSDLDAKNATRLSDALTDVWLTVKAVGFAIGAALAEPLLKFSEQTIACIAGIAKWISKNRELVVTAAKVTAIVIGIGAALFVTGLGFVGVGKTIGIVATAIASVAKVALGGLGLLTGAFKAVAVVGGTVISAFSGVFSLIGVALGTAITAIGTAFSVLAAIGTATFSAIGAAISAILSPVGPTILALGAVAGACFLVYRNANTIGNAISTAFSSVIGVLNRATTAVYRFLAGFTEFRILFRTINTVSTAVTTLGKVLFFIANSLIKPSVFLTILGIFLQFGKIVVSVAATITSALFSYFRRILGVAQRIFAAVASIVVSSFGKSVSTIGTIVSGIQMIWASIQLIWVKGSTSLLTTWYWVVDTLQTAWASCVYKLSEILTTAWYGVQEFWIETVYTMSTIWTEFSNGVVSSWKTVEKTIAKGIGYIIAQMEGLDFNELSKTIDEDYNRQARQREAAKGQKLTEIQKSRDSKMSSLEADKQGTLDILKQDFANAAGVRDAAYQAKLAAQEQELEAAKAAYDEAINRARNPDLPPSQAGESQSLADSLQSKVLEAISGFNVNTDLDSKIKHRIADDLFEMYGEKLVEGRKSATHERFFRVKAGTAHAALNRLEGYIRSTMQVSGRLHINDISLDEEQDGDGFFGGHVVYSNPDTHGAHDKMSGMVRAYGNRCGSTVNSRSHEQVYEMRGYNSEVEAWNALSSNFGWRDDCESIDVEEDSDGANRLYIGRVRYKMENDQEDDDLKNSISFEVSGTQTKRTHSILTRGSWAAGGRTPRNYGGLIGVTDDGVEGVDIDTAVSTFTETTYLYPWFLTSSYIAFLSRAYGRINDTPFRGFAIGEVRFLGASGSYRRGDRTVEMTFKFAESPNAQNIQIGDITVPFKFGWDYLWVRWADMRRGGITVKVPIEAYTEQVYYGMNFGMLGIGY